MKYTQVKECIEELGRSDFDELVERFGIDIIKEFLNGGYGSITDMEEAYQGQYTSDEDFAETLCNDCYDLSPKDNFHPHNYIDWKAVARDLMYDYFEIEGYYFRSM
jgi:antirestriction protein